MWVPICPSAARCRASSAAWASCALARPLQNVRHVPRYSYRAAGAVRARPPVRSAAATKAPIAFVSTHPTRLRDRPSEDAPGDRWVRLARPGGRTTAVRRYRQHLHAQMQLVAGGRGGGARSGRPRRPSPACACAVGCASSTRYAFVGAPLLRALACLLRLCCCASVRGLALVGRLTGRLGGFAIGVVDAR